MKKFSAGLLSAAIIIGGVTAFAADGTITAISIDPDTQYITVSGTINSESDRERVTLRVTKAGAAPTEDTILCAYQANTDESGAYTFSFSMPDGTAPAKYDAYIKSDGVDALQQSFRYFGDVSSVLSSEINGASSVTALRTFLEADQNAGLEMFGIDDETYSTLSDSGKNFVVSSVFATKQGLGGFTNGKQLRDSFTQAALVAQIREGKAEINEDTIDLLTVNYAKPVSGGYAAFGTMYETAKKAGSQTESKAYAAVRSDSVKSVEDFWKAYNDSVTNSVISGTEYWTEVRDFIADNKDLIGEHAGINWSDYSRKTENVCKALVRTEYSTLDAFAQALENAVKKAQETTTVSSGSGGSGGGDGISSGSGSGIHSGNVSIPVSIPGSANDLGAITVPGVKYAFDDLRRTPWANDAVTALVERKIVDGYGDGTFRPERNITRAEFVTLVIKAFYPNAEAMDCGFKDVSRDSWAYPYIAAASNLGIVNGIGDNQFGPELNIKRQDMAVIINNIFAAMGRTANKDDAAAFNDQAQVSEYAQDAVKMMRAAGIVNGDDGNNFNPQSEATRAESAVIIYNTLSK